MSTVITSNFFKFDSDGPLAAKNNFELIINSPTLEANEGCPLCDPCHPDCPHRQKPQSQWSCHYCAEPVQTQPK